MIRTKMARWRGLDLFSLVALLTVGLGGTGSIGGQRLASLVSEGNEHLRQDRPALAEAAYLRALSLKPDDFLAQSNLGTLYSLLERHGDAALAYRAAVRLRPHFPVAWSNLGSALLRSHGAADSSALEEAEEALVTALELRPTLLPAYANLGTVVSARLCAQLAARTSFLG